LATAVTVTAPTALVHLAAASGSGTPRKGGWTATATVSVTDGPGSAVAGATVMGTWSTGAAGSCVTAAAGSCSFSVNVGRKTPSVTWTVSGITAAGYGYDASADVGSPLTITGP